MDHKTSEAPSIIDFAHLYDKVEEKEDKKQVEKPQIKTKFDDMEKTEPSEVCPICSMEFETVGELIEHNMIHL